MNLYGYTKPKPGYLAMLRESKVTLVVFEMSPGTAGFLTDFGKPDLYHIGWAHGRVLAHRTWDGAWTVLDSGVSSLLPAIDNYVEGETTC